MTSSRMTRRFALSLSLTASMAASGCELLDDLRHRSTLLNVFATHHATPEGGAIPHRGDDGQVRVFDTSDGWTITLVKGYFVTSGITLHRCDGTQESLNMFRGTVVEDVRARDLSLRTVGGLDVTPGDFCAMTVHHTPFEGTAAPTDEVSGATVYLTGFAKRDETTVPFEVRANSTIDVELDLSTIDDGAPLRITGQENFPVELTISKTYDQFFDSMDFAETPDLDMGEHVLTVLEGVTRVVPGTLVAPV